MILIVFGMASVAGMAAAEEWLASPRVVSAVYGDVVRLQVETGAGSEVRWTWRGQSLCAEQSCDLRTAALGHGTFTIEATVSKDGDSHRFDFLVSVQAAEDRLPTTVVPSLMKRMATAARPMDASWRVRAVAGKGFCYGRDETWQVGEVAEALIETVKLKAQPESLLELGDEATVRLLIAANSTAQWLQEDARLVLLQGAFLLRNLGSETLVAFAGDVPLYLEGGAVTLVWRRVGEKGRQMQLFQLQGVAWVGNGRSERIVDGVFYDSLAQGAGEAAEEATPPPDLIEGTLADLSIEGDTLHEPFDSLADALQAERYFDVHLALAERDTESLSAEERRLLSETGVRLFLLESAEEAALGWQSRAATAWQPRYYLGLVSLLRGDDDKALQLWRGLSPSEVHQEFHYYKGVAAYRLNRSFAAASAFRYSLWRPQSERLSDSAKQHLATLKARSRFDAAAEMSFLYDDNVARISPSRSRRAGEPWSDAGLALALGAETWVTRNQNGGVFLPVSLQAVAYRQPDLAPAAKAEADAGLFFQFLARDDGGSLVYSLQSGPRFRLLARGAHTLVALASLPVEARLHSFHDLGFRLEWGYGKDAGQGNEKPYLLFPDERASVVIDDHTLQESMVTVTAKPTLDGSAHLPLRLTYRNVQLAKPAAKLIDHQELAMTFGYSRQWTPRWQSDTTLKIVHRQFSRWPGGARSDLDGSLSGSVAFAMWSHLNLNAEAEYQRRNSSSDEHSFGRYQVRMGASTEF